MGLGIGMLFTLPTLLLAFISAGGGHGDYLWAKAFFPYVMCCLIMADTAGIEMNPWLVTLAFVQFPVYGVLIGVFASTLKKAVAVAAIIGIVHAAVAALCLSITSKYFS